MARWVISVFITRNSKVENLPERQCQGQIICGSEQPCVCVCVLLDPYNEMRGLVVVPWVVVFSLLCG